MDAWNFVVLELIFFAVVFTVCLPRGAARYRVSEDIWGLYEVPSEPEKLIKLVNEDPMVIIFSSDSTKVRVESQVQSKDNIFNPDHPKRSKRNRKMAA